MDLDIFERNIARIVETCRQHDVGWRPHIKAHKSPDIAKLQLAAGAIGITCAKLGEAEVMTNAGIRDILIANQIVGPIKIARLMRLLGKADVIVLVDNPQNITELDQAARERTARLKVAIEVNVGMNRAGVEPGKPTLALASVIAACTNLELVGLMTWEAHAVAIGDPSEKAKVVADAIKPLLATAQACRQAGHTISMISCGGTGRYRIASTNRASPKSRSEGQSSATCAIAPSITLIFRSP